MTDTLPKVANGEKPPGDGQPDTQPTPASNASKLPSIRGGKAGDRKDGDKTSSTKADRDRKKAMELKNQPKDFFKLANIEYVEAQKDEVHINDYYKRFLGKKIDRVTERSAQMGFTQRTARSVAPDFENMIEKNKKLNEIAAFAVMKEYHGMSKEEIKKHMDDIKNVQTSIDSEYEGATNIPKTGRTSLYQTIINQNQTRSLLRKKMFGSPTTRSREGQSPVSQSIISSHSARRNNFNWSKTKRDEKWGNNQTISSSQHLMKYTSNQDTQEIMYDASNLYLPPTQRLLAYDNRLRADRKLKPLPEEEKKRLQLGRNASSIMKQLGVDPQSPKSAKKSSAFKLGPLGGGQPGFAKTIDVRSSAQSKHQVTSHPSNVAGVYSQVSGSSNRNLNVKFDLQLKHGVASINSEETPQQVNQQTFRQSEINNITSQRVSKQQKDIQSETFQPSGRVNSTKFKKVQRRASFCMTQTKYKDAKTLWHPLKEAEGPILNDLATIAKMKAAKRYPVQEKLLHKPDGWDLFIDSIMHTAYNSDENEDWAVNRKDIGAPANSMESMEVIDFQSSSDEEENKAKEDDDPIKKQIEALARENKTDEVVMYCRVHADKKSKRKKGSLLPAILPPDTKPAQDIHEKISKIRIHKDAMELHGFDLEIMEQYPHRMRDGDIPSFLLKDNVTMFIQYPEIQQKIELEFKYKNLFKTDDHIQLVFEQFCNLFDCNPLPILKFFQNNKLSFENYNLSVPQAKAVACTIPLLSNLKEIYFHNNDLGDQMCAVILMAAFQNPCLDSISMENNKLGRSASLTFQELLKQCPKKITKLSLSHSKNMGTYLQNFIANIGLENDWAGAENPGCKLSYLNLSNTPISSAGCQHIGRILIHQKALRNLDISSCNIVDMGTRYVIDGLNRNIGLEYFNFAYNGLQSEMYEFSIKMAKIISRHLELLHVDLTHTGLEKEEVIFIGMTLPCSTSMLGLHLSLNDLGYYDRIFLRTLINAKLVYRFKNMAQDRLNGIRSQSEKNIVDELGTQDFFDEDLKYFVKTFESIEAQKLDLDEDVSKLMDEVDILEIFNDIKAGKVKNAPAADVAKASDQTEVLTALIENIKNRQLQIDAQRERVEKFHDQHIDFNDPQTIENFKTMGLYNRDKDGNPLNDDKNKQGAEKQLYKEDLFLMSNALKIDRIRIRVEQDALKNATRKGKSVGEIALQFNGINKIAYDLLQDNPMSLYTDKIIFTRILGQEHIQFGDVWKDTCQCWVCEKWNFQKIDYNNDHKEYMKQNIRKLGQLDEVLKKLDDPANHDQVQVLTQAKVKEIDYKLKNKKSLDEIAERSQEGSDASGNESDNTFVGKKNRNQIGDQEKDFLDDDSEILEEEARTQLANTNPLSNRGMGFQEIRQELPENFAVVQDIQGNSSDDSVLHDSSDDEYVRFSGIQPTQSSLKNSTYMQGVNRPSLQQVGMMNNTYQNKHQQKLLGSQDNFPPKTPASIKSKKDVLRIAESEKKIDYKYTRKVERDGVMYKIVERKVFFQGIEYALEDEVKIDSDEETSIHTSEDDFQVDDDEVVTDVKEYYYNNPVKKDERLEAILKKNGHAYKERNEALRNVFGRKQIFMVASFNDWIPVEMKTLFEIKMEKKEGDNLLNFVKENKELEMKSEKPSHNLIQAVQYIPPGRHFFYFVYNRKRVILSPDYSIVRFKGTNVFLNQIEVKKRETELQRVSIKRNLDEMVGGFRKEKSVFRTYQDDNEDTTQMMLEQDMKYSKIMRDCRTEVERADLAKVIEKYYPKLKNIYLFQISKSSSYPVMDQDDIDKFFNTGVIGRNLNKATIDRLVLQTTLPPNPLKQSGERTLHRFEFIELLVRVGFLKYKEQKPTVTMNEATESFLTKDILPRNERSSIEATDWRETYLYTAKVHEIMRKNDKELKLLFEKNLGNRQKYLQFDDVVRVIKKAQLNLTDDQIKRCFIECLMSRVDTLKDVKAAKQMKYIEFIVMIGRVCHEIYRKTKEEGIDLHEKIDKVLEPLLATELLTPAFSFNKQKQPALTTGGTEQSQDFIL